jgi:AcrR family transcriptional regulator
MPGAIRGQILAAAEECIRAQGMARVTTKDIARQAGCSEGSIYNHFVDKLDLFRALITERLADLDRPIRYLGGQAGTGSVRERLDELLEATRTFFAQLIPLAGSVFADPELLARCRIDMDREGTGPYRVLAAVAEYVRAEQRLGRITTAVTPEVAAMLLVGAAYEGAYTELLTGRAPDGAGGDGGVVDLLCAALVPMAPATR